MRTVLRSFRNEFAYVLKTPWLLISGVLVPLFWVTMLACVFSAGLMRNLPMGLVDNDNSAESRETIEVLESIPSIKFIRFESTAAAQEAMAASKIYGLTVFPQDWSAKVAGSRSDSAIELYLNRSYYVIAVTLESDIKMALSDIAAQKLIASAAKTGGGFHGAKARFSVVSTDILLSGNPTINYHAYLLATLIPGLLALGCILTCVGVLTREWRKKTVTQLLDNAQSLRAVLTGRLLFWISLFSIYAVGYVAWFAGWQGWSPQGSLLVWCIGAILLMTAMGACALMITSLAPSWIVAMSAAICYIAPTFPFTGFSYPIESMDAYAQALCQIFPLTWFLKLQSSQWILASDLAHTSYLLLMMALFTLVPASLGYLCIKANFDRKGKKENSDTDRPEKSVPRSFWGLMLHVLKCGTLNPDTFVIFVGAIAFYLVFYAWPYSNQQITNIPVAVVDLDRSAASRNIVHRIDSLTMLKIKELTTQPSVAETLYKNEKVDAVITIPENFEANLLAGKATALRLTANGAFPVKGRASMASLTMIASELSQETSAVNLVRAGVGVEQIKSLSIRPVALTDQSLYNTLAGYAAYMVPLVMPIILQAVMSIALSMTLGGWLACQQAPQVLKTVLGSTKGFAAFFTGFWIFGLAWMLYALGPDFAIFNFTSLANPIGALLVAILFVGAVVWFGTTATLLMNTNAYAAQCLVLISAPAVFLTGAVFASHEFLLPAKIIACLLPTTPGCIAMISAAQNGASTLSLMPYLLHLLILNLVFGLASIYLARLRARERGWLLR